MSFSGTATSGAPSALKSPGVTATGCRAAGYCTTGRNADPLGVGVGLGDEPPPPEPPDGTSLKGRGGVTTGGAGGALRLNVAMTTRVGSTLVASIVRLQRKPWTPLMLPVVPCVQPCHETSSEPLSA